MADQPTTTSPDQAPIPGMPTAPAELLRLAPEHLEELHKGSGISIDVLVRSGIKSEDDPKFLSKLVGKTPKEWADGRVPAWVIPYRLPGQRDAIIWRGKPLKPFELAQRNGEVKLQKYAQMANTGVHLYFGPSFFSNPKALTDASIPLWITEGEKKTLSAESHGLSCIGLGGVDGWHKKGERTLHPYFAWVNLSGREVFICFDYDAITNANVRRAELELGRALEAAGAAVRIVRLPQDSPKLDDFFVRHEASELEYLIADARDGGRLPPDVKGSSDVDWSVIWSKLRLDHKTDKPIKDIDNVTTILLHHPLWEGVLAYDARKEKQSFVKQPPFADDFTAKGAAVPRDIVDGDVGRIAAWLVGQKALGWTQAPKSTTIEPSIEIVCQRKRFDGVQRYLHNLKWDGVTRLDEAAHTHLGAENTRYNRVVFAKWMLSAVARAARPGCQVDHVLVLEGSQGTGKSTALRILASDEYFASSLPDITQKDAHEYCVGPWIIELGELDHVRKAEVTALKAFITERSPRFRPAYGRRASDHPRRCVFAGSTNDDSYLADATGNRRFWPLKTGAIDLEALRIERDQLWAEAVTRVRNGETWHLDTDIDRVAAEREQSSRRIVDAWHMKIEAHLDGRDQTTIPEILSHLGLETARHDQRSMNRVAAILRESDWVRKQVSMGKARVWVYRRSSPVLAQSGAESGAAQVVDLFTKSPVSPLSPVSSRETENTERGTSKAAHVNFPLAGKGGQSGATGADDPFVDETIDERQLHRSGAVEPTRIALPNAVGGDGAQAADETSTALESDPDEEGEWL